MEKLRRRTRNSSSARSGSDDEDGGSAAEEDDLFFSGEFGLVGALQGDETHLDDRDDVLDDDGRIRFSKKKLYRREKELLKLHTIFDRMTTESIESDTDGNGDSAEISTSDSNVRDSEVIFLSGYSGCGKSALIQEFASGVEGAWGFFFDPVTNDFFVTTYSNNYEINHFTGFPTGK